MEEIQIEEKKHIIDVDNKRVAIELEERRWKSCCFQLEPESSMFFAKLTISAMTIALCSFQ